MKRTFQTRALAYKKDNLFVGVALDFDLIVQGKSLGEAIDRLEDCIKSYLETCVEANESDKQIYRKAPKKYFDIYALFLDLQKNKANKERELEKNRNKFLGVLSSVI